MGIIQSASPLASYRSQAHSIVQQVCTADLEIFVVKKIFMVCLNHEIFFFKNTKYVLQQLPYLLDQTLLSISCCSRIVATPPDVLNEIVATLEY